MGREEGCRGGAVGRGAAGRGPGVGAEYLSSGGPSPPAVALLHWLQGTRSMQMAGDFGRADPALDRWWLLSDMLWGRPRVPTCLQPAGRAVKNRVAVSRT